MNWLRRLGVALGWLTGISVIALGVALWLYRDVPAAAAEAKYANEASRFMHIDGARIHYRDEGTGPAILLLHANFSNLLGWDPWVEVLKANHRVVRFDFTAFGLTGPDPGGDYSNERTLELTEKFIEAVQLKRFAIAGTSLGGGIAIRYAAKNPERVDSLILLNPGVLEGRAMAQSGATLPEAANVIKYFTPRAIASYMLRSRAGDPTRITDEHIDRWYEGWMREGNRSAILDRLRAYSSADVVDIIGKVEVPVLVLWGEANPQTPIEQAGELMTMLKGTSEKRLITYPGVGHPALEEAGALIAKDVAAWLAGTLPPAASSPATE